MKAMIVGGVDLGRWYPELSHATLWCVTELNTREQIDSAARVVAGAPVEA
jgi:glycine dehydrogenase subunit 1